ncbi:MAG: ABC transporter permease [Herbinix sp.]|nr:ABC transporter permease [Herbinix sp.]
MYQRIIKKDLMRKKTMNIILLLFIILASTFVSSSVNNLISISTALPNYFDRAGLYDYIIMTINDEKNDANIAEFLNESTHVNKWVTDEYLYVSRDDIRLYDGELITMDSTAMISRVDIKQQKFFDSNNDEIKEIADGEIYMPIYLMKNNNLQAGDKLSIKKDDYSIDLTIRDSCKDAFMGSSMMGVIRLLVSDNDYSRINEYLIPEIQGKLYSIDAHDIEAFKKEYNKEGFAVVFSGDQSMISTTYIMDMLIALLFLVVSVCLIVISFVILKFTILFTLQEEIREIGVMKAIGIRSRRIRGLYILKYLIISIVGALLGFLLSIPFGNMLLDQVSENIIISNNAGGVFVNAICSLLIVGVVIFFCYSCTHQINKLSPIRAIRNGSEGERFKRKGLLRLGKSHLPTVLYLAMNNIFSAPKRFGALVITFTIGIILIIVPINTINTLSDKSLIAQFNMAESDAYLINESKQIKYITGGNREFISNDTNAMEEKLKDNGINASVYCEVMFQYRITHGDYSVNSMAMQGVGISAEKYLYTSGQAPKYSNEVAITHITSKEIGASIGDTVKINTGNATNTEKEYMVTGIYQTLNNLGVGIRFSEKEELNYLNVTGVFPIQIKYIDDLSEDGEEEYLDRIKKIYSGLIVKSGDEYIEDFLGDITEQLEGTKRLIVGVIVLINILVTILMVKTFIIKEKAEIGLLKSTGFRNSSIIGWQVLRIGIILIISMVLGTILSNPISQISTGKGFEMMGASHIEFVIKPLEVYVLYPLLILALTLIASIITALQIRRVSVQETHNIE